MPTGETVALATVFPSRQRKCTNRLAMPKRDSIIPTTTIHGQYTLTPSITRLIVPPTVAVANSVKVVVAIGKPPIFRSHYSGPSTMGPEVPPTKK